ncbi:hypothetical protein M513_08314 [Trichuris suis]|uniref:Uncharacterized protein n=1 Tax=Trichuris suis TaxID=68888 RepID=A0A085M0M7_9BILA|nr:hypothetical protein M513_08314 [Trichuris suis]
MNEAKKQCLLRWVNLELQEYGETINTLDARPTFKALRRIAKKIVEIKPQHSDEIAVLRTLADFYGDEFIDPLKQEGEQCSWKGQDVIAKVVALLMNFVLTCDDRQELHVRMVMENMHSNDQVDIMNICTALGRDIYLAESDNNDSWADVLKDDYSANQCSPIETLHESEQGGSNHSHAKYSPQSFISGSSRSSKSSPLSSSLSECVNSPGLKRTALLRLKNQEIKRLKNALREKEYYTDCVGQENFDLKNSLSKLEEELKSLKMDNVVLSEQVSSKEALVEELKENNSNAQTKLSRLEKQLSQETEEKTNLQEKVVLLQEQCAEYAVEMKHLKQKNASLNKAENEMKEKFTVMQMEHSNELTEMGCLLKTMQVQKERMLTEQNDLKDDNAFLTRRCKELESRKDTSLLFKKYITEKLLYMKQAMTLLVTNLEITEKVLAECQKLATLAIITKKCVACEAKLKPVEEAEEVEKEEIRAAWFVTFINFRKLATAFY